jgi:CubicO group peptidase (beta-lactamase class C family)
MQRILRPVLMLSLVSLLAGCGATASGQPNIAPPSAAGQRPFVATAAQPAAEATPPPIQEGAPVSLITTAVPIATAPLPTPTFAGPVGEAGRALDRYMNDLVAGKLFQGAVLVAKDDTVLLSKGYGPADAGANIPNTATTRFRLASLTKTFTGAAIMLLQARGKLQVSDPICNYVVSCPSAWAPITIRHLLTHTSGLPNYTDFMDYEPSQGQRTSPDQLLARFRDLPLNYEPGTVYHYENSDYVVLGTIIERASGQPYDQFLHDAIFAPLGMSDSGFDWSQGRIEGLAQGYQAFGDPAPFLDASTLFSAGGLYSTVEDMYRWTNALDDDRLLPASLRTEVFTPFLNGYGYGWKITSINGRPATWHPGNMDGSATYIVRFPDDDVTVIVLSNMAWADAQGIAGYLANIALNSP